MGDRTTKWSIFEMVSFLEYSVFLQAFFAENNSIVHVESFSAYFGEKTSWK